MIYRGQSFARSYWWSRDYLLSGYIIHYHFFSKYKKRPALWGKAACHRAGTGSGADGPSCVLSGWSQYRPVPENRCGLNAKRATKRIVTPGLNPIERLWLSLHETLARNHQCLYMWQLLEQVNQFMNAASPFPAINTDWLKWSGNMRSYLG